MLTNALKHSHRIAIRKCMYCTWCPNTSSTLLLYPLDTHTVTNLRVVNITTNSATITWDQPPHNYRVFLHGEATDNIPQSRVINETNVTGQTTHVVQGLHSFRNYSIGVYLESNLGWQSSVAVTFQTLGRGESADQGCLCVCVHACVHASVDICAHAYMCVHKYTQ